MRTLLTESQPGCGLEVAAQLTAAGHEVLRCHPAGAPAFPCVGLDGPCPLEDPPGVDVAVAVRALTDIDTTGTELGTTCALRHAVPVVVVSAGGPDPYGDRVERSASSDVVTACTDAAEVARDAIVDPLRAEARRLVAERGGDPTGIDVRIDRDRDRVRIEIELPPGADDVAELVATRLHAVYRPTSGDPRSIDVEVVRPQEVTR